MKFHKMQLPDVVFWPRLNIIRENKLSQKTATKSYQDQDSVHKSGTDLTKMALWPGPVVLIALGRVLDIRVVQANVSLFYQFGGNQRNVSSHERHIRSCDFCKHGDKHFCWSYNSFSFLGEKEKLGGKMIHEPRKKIQFWCRSGQGGRSRILF